MSRLPVRRLLRNGNNQTSTSPEAVFSDKSKYAISGANGKEPTSPMVAVIGKSTDVKAIGEAVLKANDIITKEGLAETAAGPNDGLGSAMIRGRNVYGSILDEYVYTDIETNDSRQMGKSKDTSVNRIYRDIYYHDPISGGGVDLLSTMPWSDFTLAGAKQDKTYDKYYESTENMNYKVLMPTLGAEYMVHGMFVATTLFDNEEGVYEGIIPQQPDYVEVEPVPIFGRDPLINLMIGEAAKNLTATDDPRMKQYADMIPKGMDTLKPNPEDVIYVARRALVRDSRGVSLYRRLLTSWLLERALYRGTLDQSMKRQRSITHLMLGDTDWTPTQDEMSAIASNLVGADLDPVGAIFVTRTGVQVNDIRSANDLWKVTDLTDFFNQNKLRMLGISEAFLSGEYSVNALDQAMSVFVEQIRSYRDMVTHELFYDKVFPRIAHANDFVRRRVGLETAGENGFNDLSFKGRNPPRFRVGQGKYSLQSEPDLWGNTNHFFEKADGIAGLSRADRNNLFIPEVHWHKRLRPEADDQYLTMLTQATEAGLPIPLRLYAAAMGLDIDAIKSQQKDDIALRDTFSDWIKKIHPPEAQDGGMPSPDGGGDMSLSMINGAVTKRLGTLNRKYDQEAFGPRNIGGDGKRHLLSAQGRKYMDEKINKSFAETAAKLGARVNAMEAKIEEFNREKTVTSKIYT